MAVGLGSLIGFEVELGPLAQLVRVYVEPIGPIGVRYLVRWLCAKPSRPASSSD